jgi:hypothetical protein
MFFQLGMDIDLILPLIESAKERKDLVPIACVSDQVSNQSPGLLPKLCSLKIHFEVIRHDEILSGRRPSLRGMDGLVSASESTANPHRAAHTLTVKANAAGLRTYTVQHGFENIGITYFDQIHNLENIRFASQTIFTWCPIERLHESIPEETKRKCLPVGCCKNLLTNFDGLARPGDREFLVGVFENLHWHRYDENYRGQFLRDLIDIAQKFPDTTFVVKPHPAGKWLTHRYQGLLPQETNILVASPDDPKWNPYSGQVLVGLADAVITTPSTVALDAVRCGCPVGVVGYGMDLKSYCPLPILRSKEDWSAFIEQLHSASGKKEFQERGWSFLADVMLPGDACTRMLNYISADIAGAKL